MREFENQVAIVTGAGQGIGLEIARQLAQRGAAVLLNDLELDLAYNAAMSIQKIGGNCVSFAGNAADVGFVQEMVAEAVKIFGKITIIIANAGITTFGDFFEYQPESLQALLDLNIRGSFFLSQAAAIEMRKQGTGGRILLMSSVTAHQAHQYLV